MSEKKRTVNWSKEELWQLLESIQKYPDDVVKKKFGVKVSSESKQRAWTNIVREVNAVGGNGRTQAQVEKKWADTKSKSLMALATFRRESTKTGGGPPPTPPNDVDRKVEDIIGSTSISIGGIPGGVDSGQEEQLESSGADDSESCDGLDGDTSNMDSNSVTPGPAGPSIMSTPSSSSSTTLSSSSSTTLSSSSRDRKPKKRILEDSRPLLLDLEIKRANLEIEVLQMKKENLVLENKKLHQEFKNMELWQQNLVVDLASKGFVLSDMDLSLK